MTFIKEGNFYLINDKPKPYLIASSHDSSLRYDELLNRKLKELSYKGEVYVDMLLVKGASSTRFIKCYFNGKHFEVRKSQVLGLESNIVEKYFRDIEKQFCLQHRLLVENSILSYSEKQIAYGKSC